MTARATREIPRTTGLLGFVALLWAFIRRDAKISMSYRLQFFFQLASVFSICVTFFLLGLMMKTVERDIPSLGKYGGSYFGFVLIGIAFSSYFDSALRTFSLAIRSAQMTGTLEAMLVTRTRLAPLVAGSAAYPLLTTTLRCGLYVLFGATIFEVPIHFETWLSVIAIVTLTMTATVALGIFAAGFIVWFKQGDPVTSAIAGLSWLFSGILYPKEILPTFVERAADVLPMTHTLEAIRLALLTGASFDTVSGSIAHLAVFSLVGIPAASIWFRFAVDRARNAGSLAAY